MYIVGFIDIPARIAPTAAISTLVAIILLAPNRSERYPVGKVKKICIREGIATMSPICWLERLNSSLRIGKIVERILPAE